MAEALAYLQPQLSRGVAELGLELDSAQQEALLAYLELLQRWNAVYNLTAVRKPADMVVKHLLDSLAVLPHLPDGAVIDVGTGPGLPGIPLAIARPEQAFTLLDSNIKKTRFVNQAVLALGLANVSVIHGRCEEYRPEPGFAVVISRAFAELGKMVGVTRHLLDADGAMLAMKGQYPETELAEDLLGFEAREVVRLQPPGLEGARHLVMLAPGRRASG